MKYPFSFPDIVIDDFSFCNRVKERADLRRLINASQNVLLFSHRRFDKTSLIQKVFGNLKDITPMYVDLYGTTSIENFMESFLRGISGVEPENKTINESGS